ncbi:hypothetical protein AGLY_001400 [Aphis glycines]|uniref:Uncharacterized protein n=1 Tax=Aphis glycines TaxID=307491 RepID=A0A6G0U520_APHGL|nr:hypothetical protein AGLY_001400 [Aphis glycines]
MINCYDKPFNHSNMFCDNSTVVYHRSVNILLKISAVVNLLLTIDHSSTGADLSIWWPLSGIHFESPLWLIHKQENIFFYLLKYHKIVGALGLQPIQPFPKSDLNNCIVNLDISKVDLREFLFSLYIVPNIPIPNSHDYNLQVTTNITILRMCAVPPNRNHKDVIESKKNK